MKKIVLFCILSLFMVAMFTVRLFAQKETYDLITYSPPKGWGKEVKENSIVYTTVDKKNNSWCQVGIFKSTTGKGSIDKDFEAEWRELVVKQRMGQVATICRLTMEAD